MSDDELDLTKHKEWSFIIEIKSLGDIEIEAKKDACDIIQKTPYNELYDWLVKKGKPKEITI